MCSKNIFSVKVKGERSYGKGSVIAQMNMVKGHKSYDTNNMLSAIHHHLHVANPYQMYVLCKYSVVIQCDNETCGDCLQVPSPVHPPLTVHFLPPLPSPAVVYT